MYICIYEWKWSVVTNGMMQTEWNQCIRRLWKLPYVTHTKYRLYLCNNVLFFQIRFFKMHVK